ncbi:MAG TPA: hypothetical protein VJZ06_06540 [Mobilitalea sp.]|nr:hypothetical protein [Mobilitalea sp.]
MKEELIVIEEGEITVRGNPLFTDLYLQICKGEVLGVVFGNVTDRKCLIELFRGEQSLCGGKVFVGNKRTNYEEALIYFKKNATIIEKNSKLIDNLSIEENIFLFADENTLVSTRKYKSHLQTMMKKFSLDFSLKRPIGALTTKEKIVMELLKAYYDDKKLVVLNHISGQLLNNDLEDIHELIKKLTKYGVSFIIIEAFNNIVFEWVNCFLLIQEGKTTGIFDTDFYNSRQLYTILMENTKTFGSPTIKKYIQGTETKNKLPLLEFKNVSTSYIHNLNLKLEEGEILNLFFMDDESFEHILKLLEGYIKPSSGEISLCGCRLNINSIHQAVDSGICFISESPYENTLFYNMTLEDNLGLALSNKVPFYWLKKRYRRSLDFLIEAFHLEDYLHVKLRKLDPRILQEVAYLKWYLYAPHLVVCIKPFTDLDINLLTITKEMIFFLNSRGIAVLVLSSMLSKNYSVGGDTIYIKNGTAIDESEIYEILYRR